jgi:dihydrofolate reductase
MGLKGRTEFFPADVESPAAHSTKGRIAAESPRGRPPPDSGEPGSIDLGYYSSKGSRMRKIILSNMTTLDGYFEGPKRSIDWHHVDAEFFEESNALLDSVDTLLFGRVTYQLMEGYWTTDQAMQDDPVITRKMNGTPKIVFSRTLEQATWRNTRLIKENVAAEVAKLKSGPGKDMVIFGSSNLAASLLDMGLLDELRIIVNPVLIGDGTPQFKGLKTRTELKLLGAKTYKNGNVLLTYEPAKKAA